MNLDLKTLPRNYTYFFIELEHCKDLVDTYTIGVNDAFDINGKKVLIVGITTYELLSSCDIVTYSEDYYKEANKDKIYGLSVFKEGDLLYFTEVNKKDLKFAFFQDVVIYSKEKSIKCHSKQMQLDLENLIKVVDFYES